LGNAEIFIGHDWLYEHNPKIDWRKGTIDLTNCDHDKLKEPDSKDELPFEPGD
jgi:hypothetical protein